MTAQNISGGGTVAAMPIYSQVVVSPIPDGMTEQEFIEKVKDWS